MQQSKLISLLRKFTKEEFKHFESFLLSPYFNQSQKLVKFFKLLEPHQPLFNSKKLEKEKLYEALHGPGKYNDSTMRELISDLFKLAKSFTLQRAIESDELQSGVLKFNWFYSRNLEKLAESELDNIETVLEGYTEHNEVYYYHRWLNERNKFIIGIDKSRDAAYKYFEKHDVAEQIHTLNRAYLVNFLSAYHHFQAYKLAYNYSVDDGILLPLETLAAPYIRQGDTIVDMHFIIFQLTRTGDDKLYHELKELLLHKNNRVPESLVIQAAIALKNHCAIKISDGFEPFRKEILQILRFEVENNYYLYNGTLTYAFYFNVANIVSEADELDWADHFTDNYKHFLPEEYREDAYNYAKAHILFARGLFKDALRMALSCKIPFPVSKILIRNLVARSQYELGMLYELQTELDTHRHHLKDEKLTEDYREKFQLFIQVMRPLAELKGNYNLKKLEALSRSVDKEKIFASKWWFQRKIKELKELH